MMLANVVASGYKVSIGDAAITALLGYAVVFFGLFLLMLVVIAMGKIMGGATAKKAAAPAAPVAPAAAPVAAAPVAAPAAAPAAPAPGTAGEVLLVDTTEKDAACIMAIVADKMGKPLNELRFVSIKKEVK